MAMEELIAYVVLLSLPLWLLIEQLLFIRMTRTRTGRKETASTPEAGTGPTPRRRVLARAFHRPLRSGQR